MLNAPKHICPPFFLPDRSVLIIGIVFMVSALRTIYFWRTHKRDNSSDERGHDAHQSFDRRA